MPPMAYRQSERRLTMRCSEPLRTSRRLLPPPPFPPPVPPPRRAPRSLSLLSLAVEDTNRKVLSMPSLEGRTR
jgi:hypothetical protein